MRLFENIMLRLRLSFKKKIAPTVRILEKAYFKSLDAPPPIFIIGAPRTGSTILYQALTNSYQVSYIDNLACTWHRNLRFGLMLSYLKFRNKPHNNFRSNHGDTKKFGAHAPSECGQFWYRWLPKDRHFIDYENITEEMVRDIRTEVLGAAAYLKKPILFKNLNAGQRLRLIHRCFPDAKIIFVRRDPRFVVNSIVRARKKAGVKPNEWWSIIPRNINEILCLPEKQMCAAQVYYLEKQIETDIDLFAENNVRSIHYQNLSSQLINELADWLGVEVKHGGVTPSFKSDKIELLDKNELIKLNRVVSKYEFRKELFI
ncbi:MAG: sulfotransferase [Idiomarina sp.]